MIIFLVISLMFAFVVFAFILIYFFFLCEPLRDFCIDYFLYFTFRTDTIHFMDNKQQPSITFLSGFLQHSFSFFIFLLLQSCARTQTFHKLFLSTLSLSFFCVLLSLHFIFTSKAVHTLHSAVS